MLTRCKNGLAKFRTEFFNDKNPVKGLKAFTASCIRFCYTCIYCVLQLHSLRCQLRKLPQSHQSMHNKSALTEILLRRRTLRQHTQILLLSVFSRESSLILKREHVAYSGRLHLSDEREDDDYTAARTASQTILVNY